MSAVAALAVVSPFAYVAVSELATDTQAAPQHREFVRASLVGDLPDELVSALSQGLSQFGINLPQIPGLSGFGGSGLTSPGLASPGLTSPSYLTPGATTAPGLYGPGAVPSATSPGLTDPGLTNPGLTSPAGLDPSLSSPGLTSPGDMPSTTPTGLDPGADGTYPILGDPSLGAAPSSSGGIVNDVMNAAQQLGVGQAIDLLKGAITQAAQSTAPAAAVPPAPAPSI